MKRKQIERKKKTIGRIDKLDLPDMGLVDVDVKIDTGAFSSSIHCSRIEIVEVNRESLLHFVLLDPSHVSYNKKSFFFRDFQKKRIKNSFGQAETRFVIRTSIKIFGKLFLTEFSLSNRGNLRFPVLLGRKLLKKEFLVDVSKNNLSFKEKYIL